MTLTSVQPTLQRRVVLVVGSTGQTGVQVARCLAQETRFREHNTQPDCIIFLVRSLEKGEAKLLGLLTGSTSGSGGVQEFLEKGKKQKDEGLLSGHELEFAPAECRLVRCADVSDSYCLAEAFDQAAKTAGGHPVTHVVNALGTTDSSDSPDRSILTATENLMKECARVGVRRYVHCSVAYVTRPEATVAKMLNSFARNIIGYHAVAEDTIRSTAHSSNLEYVIVRPGGLDHGNPGDGFEVSQGDDIKGGPIRRSRLAEVMCKALDSEVVQLRPSQGLTMEACGRKSADSQDEVEMGWGGFPVNKPLDDDAWRGILSELTPDPEWQGVLKDHMSEHHEQAWRFRMSIGCACLACIAVPVGLGLFFFL